MFSPALRLDGRRQGLHTVNTEHVGERGGGGRGMGEREGRGEGKGRGRGRGGEGEGERDGRDNYEDDHMVVWKIVRYVSLVARAHGL